MTSPQEAFPEFFKAVLSLKEKREQEGVPLRMHERTAYLVFTINVFQVCAYVCVRMCATVCVCARVHIVGGMHVHDAHY